MKMANEVRLIDANKLPITTEFFDDGEYSIDFVYASAIRQAPTIDPESLRPKGRWDLYRESEISKTVYCTNCWKEFYIHRKGELQIDTQPYCPNCGAKMEG